MGLYLDVYKLFKVHDQFFGFNRLSGEIIQFDSEHEANKWCGTYNQGYNMKLSDKYIDNFNNVVITVELNNICNLDCVYCYQTKKNCRKEISCSLIEKVVQYIAEVHKQSAIHMLRLRFIGGEPLLSIEKLKFCYEKIKTFCISNEIELLTHIDTNGTIPFIDILQEIPNLDMTICLSTREDHNFKRSDSFDKILSNLRATADMQNCPITIRYNVAHDNYEKFDEFLCFVKQEMPQIKYINTAWIMNNAGVEKFTNKLERKAFAVWNSAVAIDTLMKHGFPVRHCIRSKLTKCQGYQKYSCKIYSDGAVTVCDAMQHEEAKLSLDELLKDINLLTLRYANIKNYSPLEDLDCRKCSSVIQCGGKFFCRGAGDLCNYQSEYDEDSFIITYIKYYMQGNSTKFINMN